MRIIGCDLHSRQQTLSMLDAETGEVEEHVLGHEGEEVREFYSGLPDYRDTTSYRREIWSLSNGCLEDLTG
jgi:hypothetical protein